MITVEDITEGQTLKPVQEWFRTVVGRRIAPATLTRLVKKGNAHGRLDAVYVNGAWHCTAQKFADFVNLQTKAKLGKSQDSSADKTTDEELAAVGIEI